MEVYDSILDTIGNTPIVRLPRLNRGLKPTLLAKLEMFNPGNSVKDRIGINMIKDAEEKGLLKKGGTWKVASVGTGDTADPQVTYNTLT